MSIVGTWNLKMNTPMGEQSFTLTLNEDGSGKTSSQMGSADISGATIDGDSASYTVQIEAMGQKMEVSCDATADGDSIKGKMTTPMGGAEFTGERAS